MKNGAPIKAVMLPGGISDGGIITFDKMSPTVMKMIPPTIENGISFRLSAPAIVRTMCGTTKPIKPITPLQHTIELTMSVHTDNMMRFVFSTFTPKLCAV